MKIYYSMLFFLLAFNAFAEPPISSVSLDAIRLQIEAKGIKVKAITVEEKTFEFEGHEQAKVLVETEGAQKVRFNVLVVIANVSLPDTRVHQLALNNFLRTYYFQLPLPEGKGHGDLREVLKETHIDLHLRIQGLRALAANMENGKVLKGSYYGDRLSRTLNFSFYSLAQMKLLDEFISDKIILTGPYDFKDIAKIDKQIEYIKDYRQKMMTARDIAEKGLQKLEEATVVDEKNRNLMILKMQQCDIYLIELDLILENLKRAILLQQVPDSQFDHYEKTELRAELRELEVAFKYVELMQEQLLKNSSPERWEVIRKTLLKMGGILPSMGVITGLSCRVLIFGSQLALLQEEIANAKKNGVASKQALNDLTQKAHSLTLAIQRIQQEADRYKVSEIKSTVSGLDPVKPFAHFEILSEQMKLALELTSEARRVPVRR